MSSALLVLANLVAPSPALLSPLASPAAGGNLDAAAVAGLRSSCAPAPGSSHPATALAAPTEDGFAAARASVRSANGLKVGKRSQRALHLRLVRTNRTPSGMLLHAAARALYAQRQVFVDDESKRIDTAPQDCMNDTGAVGAASRTAGPVRGGGRPPACPRRARDAGPRVRPCTPPRPGKTAGARCCHHLRR